MIENAENGWTKITDMLRGSFTCNTASQIMDVL